MTDFNKDGITYKLTDLGETKPRITIGGEAVEKFVPNLNISFECFSGAEKYFLNLNRKSVVVTDQKESLSVDGELKLSTGDETDIWRIVDGKLKWDIELSTRPASYIIEWEILASHELRFIYQDSIENDYAREPDKLKESCSLEKYLEENHRPEHIIGSYAVYCDKKGGTQNAKYFTGKLCHITRPLCIDADGKTEWAELYINDGILRVTLPAKWMEKAAYPVTLDPTIGYDTQGAAYSTISNYILACRYTAPEAGDANTGLIKAYLLTATGAEAAAAAYANNGGTPSGQSRLSDSTYEDVADGSGSVLYSQAITWTGILAQDYFLAVNGVNCSFYYDTGTGGVEDREYKEYTFDGTMPATFPTGLTQGSAREYSIWVEYTASAGGETYNESISEKINLADSERAGMIYGLGISESVRLSESMGPRTVLNVNISDSINLIDAIKASLIYAMRVGESISLRDIQVTEAIIPLQISEGITLSDSVKGQFVFSPRLSDRFSLADAITAGFLFYLPLNEVVSLTDSLIIELVGGAQIFNESLTEKISIAESISAILRYYADIREQVNLAEVIHAASVMNLSLAEFLNLKDAAAEGVRIFFENLTERLSLSDSAAAMFIHALALAESFNMADQEKAALTFNLSVTDRFQLTDALAAIFRFGLVITENMTVGEIIVGTATSATITIARGKASIFKIGVTAQIADKPGKGEVH